MLNLSDDKVNFEGVLKRAEEERRNYEKLLLELETIKREKEEALSQIQAEKDKIIKEREKIYANAKAETKRIVADKLSEAEEIILELKDILKRANLESKEVFRASELKNRIKNSRYLEVDINEPIELIKSDALNLKKGDKIYSKSLGSYAVVSQIRPSKKEIEVFVGNIRSVIKFSDVFNAEKETNKNNVVNVSRKAVSGLPVTEINVIGKTSLEALSELTNFIAQAVMHGLEEIKVIHGVGQGILLKTVRDYLKKDKNVKEFRRGKYGEGENGVTIITLK
jgi:DNA mismatch repair protein MutS2